MEKNGEFKPENETQAAKETQKKIYTPIEKSAGIHIIELGSYDNVGANRAGDAFKKKD